MTLTEILDNSEKYKKENWNQPEFSTQKYLMGTFPSGIPKICIIQFICICIYRGVHVCVCVYTHIFLECYYEYCFMDKQFSMPLNNCP